MLLKSLLSTAHLLALSTAISIPSPVVGDSDAGADRAEVAGIMYTKLFGGGHYYVFVTNEYSGEMLLRQSFCDIHADSREELLEGAQCRDYWQLPNFEGELTLDELRKFKHYKHTEKYDNEGGGALVFQDLEIDEGVRTSENTLNIEMKTVRSARSFEFFAWSDPREQITSSTIKVGAQHWTCKEDELTYDNDCLWTPPAGVSRQIAPYQWFSEASLPVNDLSNEPGFRGFEVPQENE